MTQPPTIALDEIMTSDSSSVDPTRHSDETFDLYSVPAFDSGQPEVIRGSEIGSSKQAVKPGDVLLSRIVPHIRRAWIVGQHRGRRQIASGEWIVFRSDRVHPSYLRYLLVTDNFHAQFMNTVAGVGGSLLRARPAQVADIEIPLPELAEQKRIAAVLERADRLRRLRRYAVEATDSVLASAFKTIFGDPMRNEKGFAKERLEDLILATRPITYGILKPGPHIPNGVPYVRVVDIQNRTVLVPGVRRTSSEIDQAYKRSRLKPGDLLLSIRGHVGRMGIVPALLDGANITQDTARLAPVDAINSKYLMGCLGSVAMQNLMATLTRGAAVQGINLGDVKELPIPVPPITLQRRFAEIVDHHERMSASHRESLRQAEHLFQTLLQGAFTDAL